MLRIPPHPTSLAAVRRYVADIATDARLDRRRSYRLCLAVDEILTNILMYGQDDIPTAQPIDIWHWQDRTALHVVVEDTGAAYEPQYDTLDRERIEQGRGGLGLFLARTNVDRFSYERRHGRNRHTFEVKRVPAIDSAIALPTPTLYAPHTPASLTDARAIPA